MSNYLTCKSCGWVHFGVSIEAAENEIRKFNDFYRRATQEVRDSYGGPSSLENYCKCFRCGGPHTEFRRALKKEIPFGSTIQPILIPYRRTV
jgi:hypothetical protein